MRSPDLRQLPAVTLFALAVSIAGCVAGSGATSVPSGAEPSPRPPASPSPNPSASPSAGPGASLLFRVEWEGGFVAPSALIGRLPIVSVYADGRVITQGPQIEIYPGPILPNLQVRRISQTAIDRLVSLARERELLRDASYDYPGIADATTTVLTLVVDGTTYTQKAYALAEAADVDATLLPADREGRAAIRAFIDALENVPSSEVTSPDEPYVALAYRLFVAPAEAVPADPNMVQAPVDWPLPSDLATIGTAWPNGGSFDRCAVVDGPDAATLRPILATANTLTPFVSNGVRYQLIVRPLLPDEAGC
ncbi:MAG TPA: hypothetical protein VIV06_01835 [Candidatus Limnocylindrales bacterium]